MSSYKQQTSKHQQRLSQIQHGVTVSLHHLGARTRARPMAVLAAYRKASSRAFGSSYSKSSSPKFVINLHQISKFNKKTIPQKKMDSSSNPTPSQPPTPITHIPHPSPAPPSPPPCARPASSEPAAAGRRRWPRQCPAPGRRRKRSGCCSWRRSK